jgi:transporter family protein
VDYRLLSLAALICWGAWGFLTKLVLRSSGPEAVALWATVASLGPILLLALAGSTGRLARPSPLVIVSGLLAGMATFCFYLAMKRGPASVVVPLSGMYIIIPAVLGYLLLREPVTLNHLLGLFCAGLAVFLLSR